MLMIFFIIGNNQEQIEEFKFEMLKEFEMTNLGLITYFLGLEVRQQRNKIFISQRKYAKEILKKFHMENYKSYKNSYASKSEVLQR